MSWQADVQHGSSEQNYAAEADEKTYICTIRVFVVDVRSVCLFTRTADSIVLCDSS